MGENGTYKALGEIHALNENIATINMSTYLNYGKPCDVCFYEYIDNIIPLINHKKIFTSGYDVREMEDDEPVVKPKNVLKCSHGEIIDTTDNISTRGGINKDVRTNIYLPHRYRQETAANAAIELTYLFLKKLWHLTETNHNSTSYFGRLLESVQCHRSLIFIIDLSNSMNENIVNIKKPIREINSNITSNKITLQSIIKFS